MGKRRDEKAVLITPLSFSFIAVVILSSTESAAGVKEYSMHDFPPDFVFGSGTSAYQVEGAASGGGRTPRIIDTFVHRYGMVVMGTWRVISITSTRKTSSSWFTLGWTPTDSPFRGQD